MIAPAAERALERTFERAMAAAGRALAEMSGQAIHVVATEVARTDSMHVIEAAGGAGTVVVGIYLGITGSISGHAVLVLQPEGAHRLAGLLLDGFALPVPVSDPSIPWFDDMELSALGEVGNVTVAAFLNEVGRHLDQPCSPTVPLAITDMAGAILDAVLADLTMDGEELLACRTSFINGSDTIEGTVLVLPQADSLRLLVDALGAA
jgi:chemotaxis protein CheC